MHVRSLHQGLARVQQAAAQAAAARSWADFTNFEYGSAWARWSAARSKSVRYTKDAAAGAPMSTRGPAAAKDCRQPADNGRPFTFGYLNGSSCAQDGRLPSVVTDRPTFRSHPRAQRFRGNCRRAPGWICFCA